MTTDAPHRSLADDVRSRDADDICALLLARADLSSPWPADLSQLARRAADDASVLEAMQGLDTTALRVLEVYAALHEAGVDEVAAVMPESAEEVAAAVQRLWTLALLWGGPVYRIVRAAQQAFGPYPCGLAPVGHEVPDPDQVTAAALEFDEADLADLVWHNPVRDFEHPLLVPRSGAYVLSREAALVLREGEFLPPASPQPELPAGAGATGQFMWAPIAGVRYLLTDLAGRPLACHESRGVSRRNLADRAAAMGVPADELLVWLELAAAAELIGVSDAAVRPTPAAVRWLHSDPSDMWSALIEAWLDSERLLTSAVPEDLGCLTTTIQPRTSLHRRHVLSVWPASARVDADGLGRTVAWFRPRMHEAVAQAPAFFAEIHALGLSEAGVATAALELLPDGVTAAAALITAAQSQATLIVQPDHTVIAGADIDTATWQLLHDLAVVESWGPVTMHRFDVSRIRQAVSGRDPQQVLEQLRRASRTPLPQSVEYLITDAARSHEVHVRRSTLVEVPEPQVQALQELGFTQLTDRVFSSDLDEDSVRTILAEAGIPATLAGETAFAQPLDYAGVAHRPDEPTVRRMAQRLLGSEGPRQDPPAALLDADPQTMADVCRAAIDSTQSLWLSYSQDGESVVELIEPVDLRSGRLTGWSISGNRAVNLPLARIAGYQENR